mmetsp:Transcript_43461/g.137431  ORF Transcript_43461/g.137431 Transcript_43461/m.137431 type:complete len:243 (+) Transcript_43461:1136-1864(+)
MMLQALSGKQKNASTIAKRKSGTTTIDSQKLSWHLASLTRPILSRSASRTDFTVTRTIRTSLLLGSLQNPPAYSLTFNRQAPPIQNWPRILLPLLNRAYARGSGPLGLASAPSSPSPSSAAAEGSVLNTMNVSERNDPCLLLATSVPSGSSTTYSARGMWANECSKFSLMTAIGCPLQSRTVICTPQSKYFSDVRNAGSPSAVRKLISEGVRLRQFKPKSISFLRNSSSTCPVFLQRLHESA